MPELKDIYKTLAPSSTEVDPANDYVLMFDFTGDALPRVKVQDLVDAVIAAGSTPDTAVVLTDGATIATDVNPTGSKYRHRFRVTLGGNRTLSNPTGMYDGQQCVWELIQDSTGSRTITLGSKFVLGTDITSTTLSTAGLKRDFLTAIYNATSDKWYVLGLVKGY